MFLDSTPARSLPMLSAREEGGACYSLPNYCASPSFSPSLTLPRRRQKCVFLCKPLLPCRHRRGDACITKLSGVQLISMSTSAKQYAHSYSRLQAPTPKTSAKVGFLGKLRSAFKSRFVYFLLVTAWPLGFFAGKASLKKFSADFSEQLFG